MTSEDELPAERATKTKSELQMAARLAELRADAGTAHQDDLPGECDTKTKKPNCR